MSPEPRRCKWCGVLLENVRSDAQFHSDTCKVRYWRWKHGLELTYQQARVLIEKMAEYFDHPATQDEARDDLRELAWLILWARGEENHVVEGEPETPLL